MFVVDLEKIEESLKVCRRIFGHLVGFAKEESGAPAVGNVNRALKSTLTILEKSMKLAGVQVFLDVDDTLPLVRGSQSDLEQLLLNLTGNARDAMATGGELHISARGGNGIVELALTDTGCGIAEEDLQRVKEPFFTTKPDGNGLGLSICRSIVWKMQGRLSIESQLGQGTCVTLRLPGAESEATP